MFPKSHVFKPTLLKTKEKFKGNFQQTKNQNKLKEPGADLSFTPKYGYITKYWKFNPTIPVQKSFVIIRISEIARITV